MVNAGRILIMPKGEWDSMTSYNMLDLVTENGVAYLARQASVGQEPALDTQQAYWQTFGSSVIPDNHTIIFDSSNDLAANIDGATLQYDSNINFIKVAIDNVSLKYDSVNGYIYADVVSSLAGLSDVQLTNIQNGQIIAYNSVSQKFVNIDLPVGGGSKIKVTTSESTLYGKTVTLSDGVVTLSGTFSNAGEYTFEGVELTGILTISSSDGTDRATRTLPVQYYSLYNVNLTFFEATLTVTFPYSEGASCTLSDGTTTLTAIGSPMAFSVPNAGTWTATVTLDGASKTDSKVISTDGQTESITIDYGTINLTYADEYRGVSLTCVNGGTTITKAAPSTGNTMIFYPTTTGTWVISGTVGGNTYSVNAVVTSLSSPVSVTLEVIPDGSTVTPTDDIQTWLECAGITDTSYTTLAEVLADTDTYTTLLGDSNACDYMARSTTWASTIVADADAMRLLGMYDYACDALLANSTWCTAICGSTYFESVLTTKIPVLTANSQCIASSYYTVANFETYKMFDGNTSTIGVCNQDYTTLPLYVGYDFTENVHIHKVRYVNSQYTNSATFRLQGSDDNSTWNDVSDDINITSASQTLNSVVPNSASYRYWRINYSSITATGGGQYAPNACEVQFYGRHTAQTDIIVSAPSDTIYYMDNGSPVTLCTTDASGVGTVDWSDLPTGDITLYSSVAKDPDDLTADYSKSIKVTKNKVEGYLMPDTGVFYWWGYKSSNVEEYSTANGWTPQSSRTFIAPTWSTNKVTLSATATTFCGVFSSNTIPMSTTSALHTIMQGITAESGAYSVLCMRTTKNLTTSPSANYAIPTSPLQDVTLTNTTAGNYYLGLQANGVRKSDMYALWYE